MVEQWEKKIKQPDSFQMNSDARQCYIEVLDSQRKFLERLNQDNNFDETLIREQIYQIDLEEERIKLI
jgi:CPA1 family monovalent cation:H+ antiporter